MTSSVQQLHGADAGLLMQLYGWPLRAHLYVADDCYLAQTVQG